MTTTPDLLPCPFCGGGQTIVQESKPFPRLEYRQSTNTTVLHRCTPSKELRGRAISFIGRDRASAIAAWNQRAGQEARKPLPSERVHDLMADAGYLDGSAERRADFINGIRRSEGAHGITGGSS